MSKVVRPEPPVGRKAIRARLAKAQQDVALVRLKRWIDGADRLEGFVVALSKSWVLLALMDYRIDLDGWTALRIPDIQAVTRFPPEDCFEIKALRARQQWPPMSPTEVEVDSLDGVLRTAEQDGRLITIHREHDRPDACWIGSRRGAQHEGLSLLEVNVAGGWARKTRRFDPEDITRVDFGGRYEDALRLAAVGCGSCASPGPTTHLRCSAERLEPTEMTDPGSVAYDAWVDSVLPENPLDSGGEWPPGLVELLHEVFERDGPVLREHFDVAWGLRALEVAEAAVARVLDDVRRTTAIEIPPVRVEIDRHLTVSIWWRGDCTAPSVHALRSPEVVAEAAEYLQEHVMEELWTTWPDCPTDGRAMAPTLGKGDAWWQCPAGDRFGPVGHLRLD